MIHMPSTKCEVILTIFRALPAFLCLAYSGGGGVKILKWKVGGKMMIRVQFMCFIFHFFPPFIKKSFTGGEVILQKNPWFLFLYAIIQLELVPNRELAHN